MRIKPKSLTPLGEIVLFVVAFFSGMVMGVVICLK